MDLDMFDDSVPYFAIFFPDQTINQYIPTVIQAEKQLQQADFDIYMNPTNNQEYIPLPYNPPEIPQKIPQEIPQKIPQEIPQENLGPPQENPQEVNKNKTKNILQFFKNAHKQFLIIYAKRRGMINFKSVDCLKSFFNIDNVQVLKSLDRFYDKKKHITMFDYETIYNSKQLKNCWETMFSRQKYLYRHLMQGRIKNPQRVEYHQQMVAFERAFRSGQFKRIR